MFDRSSEAPRVVPLAVGVSALAVLVLSALAWWLRMPAPFTLRATTDALDLTLGGDTSRPLVTPSLAVDAAVLEGFDELEIDGSSLRLTAPSDLAEPVDFTVPMDLEASSVLTAFASGAIDAPISAERSTWRLEGREGARLRLRAEPGAGAVGVLHLPSLAPGTAVRLETNATVRGVAGDPTRAGLTLRLDPISEVGLDLAVPFDLEARHIALGGSGETVDRLRRAGDPGGAPARLRARGRALVLHLTPSSRAAAVADGGPLAGLSFPDERSLRDVELEIGTSRRRLDVAESLRIGDLRWFRLLDLRLDGPSGLLALRGTGRAGRLGAASRDGEEDLRPTLGALWLPDGWAATGPMAALAAVVTAVVFAFALAAVRLGMSRRRRSEPGR